MRCSQTLNQNRGKKGWDETKFCGKIEEMRCQEAIW